MAKIVYLVAVCLIGVAMGMAMTKEEGMQMFMDKAAICQTEVGASQADIDEMIAKKPASTKEGKCIRACLMKKFEVMDANGKFVPSVAANHASQYTDGEAGKMKIAGEIIDACKDLAVSADACEAAEQYGHCFMEQAKAHNLDKFDM